MPGLKDIKTALRGEREHALFAPDKKGAAKPSRLLGAFEYFGAKYRNRVELKEILKNNIKKKVDVVGMAKGIKDKVGNLSSRKPNPNRPTAVPKESDYAQDSSSSDTDTDTDSDLDWRKEAAKLEQKRRARKSSAASSALSRSSRRISTTSARSVSSNRPSLSKASRLSANSVGSSMISFKMKQPGSAALAKNSSNQVVDKKKEAQGDKGKTNTKDAAQKQGVDKKVGAKAKAVHDPWADSDDENADTKSVSSRRSSRSNASRRSTNSGRASISSPQGAPSAPRRLSVSKNGGPPQNGGSASVRSDSRQHRKTSPASSTGSRRSSLSVATGSRRASLSLSPAIDSRRRASVSGPLKESRGRSSLSTSAAATGRMSQSGNKGNSSPISRSQPRRSSLSISGAAAGHMSQNGNNGNASPRSGSQRRSLLEGGGASQRGSASASPIPRERSSTRTSIRSSSASAVKPTKKSKESKVPSDKPSGKEAKKKASKKAAPVKEPWGSDSDDDGSIKF